MTGIDVSERTIEKARSIDPLPNVRFITKSAEALVAEGTRYDAVICSEVLEHLDNPGALLEVLYASLSDKGRLIVTVPNGKGPRESLVTQACPEDAGPQRLVVEVRRQCQTAPGLQRHYRAVGRR